MILLKLILKSIIFILKKIKKLFLHNSVPDFMSNDKGGNYHNENEQDLAVPSHDGSKCSKICNNGIGIKAEAGPGVQEKSTGARAVKVSAARIAQSERKTITSNLLKQLKEKRPDITRKEIIDRIGIRSQGSLSKYISQENAPNVEVFNKITALCKEYGIYYEQ